jgi:hypothetical protein
MLVLNEQGSDATVLLGDGKGGFAPARGSPIAAGHSPNDLAAGDFNRDGQLDVAIANHETEHLTVLLGDGRGGFAPSPGSSLTVAVKRHPHGVAAGDFNTDGNLDLVTDSWAEDRLLVRFGDGKGSFGTPGTFVADGKHPYQRIRVADLDGDGRVDIVSPNLEGDSVTILLSDGKGAFRQPPGSPFPCGDSPFNVLFHRRFMQAWISFLICSDSPPRLTRFASSVRERMTPKVQRSRSVRTWVSDCCRASIFARMISREETAPQLLPLFRF